MILLSILAGYNMECKIDNDVLEKKGKMGRLCKNENDVYLIAIFTRVSNNRSSTYALP